MDLKTHLRKRRLLHWVVLPLFFIVIVFGWKYPYLGFLVPVVMMMGMMGGFLDGRYVCGHLCPRGAFFDRVMCLVHPGKAIPLFLRGGVFRTILFVGLISFMVYRLSLDFSNPLHWGRTFWLMCVITTVVGFILAVSIHARTWCAFCPVGSFANLVGGTKRRLLVDREKCIDCGLCEKVCPMNLPILSYKDGGQMSSRDCIKCSECIAICPKQALSWPVAK